MSAYIVKAPENNTLVHDQESSRVKGGDNGEEPLSVQGEVGGAKEVARISAI